MKVPDFDLIRPIGSGSYGQVWLARSVTGLWRAVKVVQSGDRGDRRLLERELAGITRFQQSLPGEPRQLAVLHVGRLGDGAFYYVMELADDAGGSTEMNPQTYVPLTLREFQIRRGRQPPGEVLRLSIDLARALDGLHRRGLVHRDIKPSNIIFVHGVPKLADVGLVSSSDQGMTSVGTRDFLPPEGAGKPSGDIYSLGKVLYGLLTGLPADQFPKLPVELMSKPDLPLVRELNKVILAASETAAADRPASAADLLERLLRVPAGGEMEILQRRLKRLGRYARTGLAVGATLVAVLAAWASIAEHRRAEAERSRRQLAEADERQSRYTADLRRAVNALASSDYASGLAALARQENTATDLRGFEWHALRQEFYDDAQSHFRVATGVPHSLAVSADGSRFAALYDDRTLRWWSISGALVGSATQCTRLAGITADGSQALVHREGAFRLVDTNGTPTEGVVVADRAGARWPGNLALLLRETRPAELIVWDLATRQTKGRVVPAADWQSLDLFHASLDATGSRAAAVWLRYTGMETRYRVGVWRVEDGKELFAKEFDEPIYYPRLSADGRWLAFTERLAGLAIYDVDTGQLRQRLKGDFNRIDSLTFSPDGRWLASGGGNQVVRLWDWMTGQPLRTWQGAAGPVYAIAWIPAADGVLVASAEGEVRRFDVHSPPSPALPRIVYGDERFGDAVLSDDGAAVAVTTVDHRVEVWATSDFSNQGACVDLFHPLRLAQDGEVLGLGADWSIRRQRPGSSTFTPVSGPVWNETNAFPEALAVTRNGQHLAWADTAGQVSLLSIVDGARRTIAHRHEGYATAVAFSGDNLWLASGGDDGVAAWTSVETGGELGRIDIEGGIQRLAFTPDRSGLVVARKDAMVEVWSLAERRRLGVLPGHSRYVYGMAFVDEGSRLVTAGTDGRLVFWRMDNFRPVAEMPFLERVATGGDQSAYHLESSANGRVLMLRTQDGRLKIWRRP
ncbi:MAG: PD40 domain-containing protein [Verrucomicrobiales bacterium]|nr:PD40 domain-containing protein [Verrucomicrobiales bacterium]